MSIYDRFEVDKNLEKNGIWVDYGDDGAFLVAHVGGTSSEFVKAWRTIQRKNKSRFERDLVSDDESQRLLCETLAKTAILDWRDVHTRDGNKIPFSKENALKLFADMPRLGMALLKEAQDYENYLVTERQEDAKNFENTSSGI